MPANSLDAPAIEGATFKPVNNAPDIVSVSPKTLKKGSTETLTLRTQNVNPKFRFDFGPCISLVGLPVFNDTVKVKVRVDQNCKTGSHPIGLRFGRQRYQTSSALEVVQDEIRPPPAAKPKPSLMVTPKPGWRHP